jgi:hypothetical protein
MALLFVLAAATAALGQKEDDLKKLEANVATKESTYAETIRKAEILDLIKTYKAYIDAIEKKINNPGIKPEEKARYEKDRDAKKSRLQVLQDSLGAGAQPLNSNGGGGTSQPKESEAKTIKFDGENHKLSPSEPLEFTGTIAGSSELKPEDITLTIDDSVSKTKGDPVSNHVRIGLTRRDAKDKEVYHFAVFGLKPAQGETFPDWIVLTAAVGGKPLSGTFVIRGSDPVSGANRPATGALMGRAEAKRLFGKAIANEFYCIQVWSQQQLDNDFQVTSIAFKKGFPLAPYQTVHEIEEQRKILSGRNLLPLIAGALATVMSGFTPFFINIAHQNQYHKFLSLLSIPSRDAVNLYWPDRIGAHSKVIDDMAFKSDRIVPRGGNVFGVVFVPKSSGSLGNEDFKDVDVYGYVTQRTTSEPVRLQ